MAKIKGITIQLISKKETGKDPFGNPVYQDVSIDVDNVLVYPTSSDDIISNLDIYGKKAIYTLAIPKGDKNNWEDVEVFFFNKKWRTFGPAKEGMEHLLPLDWNKQVKVERYD